jgi:protein-tyrosine phosphatase
MFNFLKKKPSFSSSYFPIGTDMHSHILPGIDDGSPDITTSIRLIRGLMELGINRSVATPHIIGDMYRNDTGTISGAMQLLQAELHKQEISFELSAAAEYMLDGYFFELLDNKTPLLTVKDNLVLTEFSYAAMPSGPEQMAFQLITEGYTPILAHPERYAYYHNDYKQYHFLKDLGFLLQVNLLSLTGYYGSAVARAAKYLVKNDLVSFAGTDLHHDRHLAALQDTSNRRLFSSVFENRLLNGIL